MKTETKILIAIIILVVMVFTGISIPFVDAETFKQSANTNFKKTCTNATGSTCNSEATCNLTIKYPINNTWFVQDANMTNNQNGIFNYTLSSGKLNALGTYSWDLFCCEGNNCGEDHGTFLVTKTGVELAQDKALIYLGLLALLVFLFLLLIGSISFLPAKNTPDKDSGFILSINRLKYLRGVFMIIAWAILLAIFFTSSNIAFLYLETTMMGDLLFNIYTIMMWLTLPMVFVWFIWIFVSIFQDAEMKKLIERGIQIEPTP